MLAILLKVALGGWNWLKLGLGWVGSFLKSLNAQGVIGLVASIALAWVALHQWGEARHWKKQSDRFEALYNKDEAANAKIAAQARSIINDLDQIGQNISSMSKGWNDAQISRIADSAASVRVRGPGKAACTSNPVASAAASGPQSPNGTGNASVASVPSVQGFDLIGLPFPSTVDFAQQHDDYRAEVLTWRSWYAALAKSWPQSSPNPQSSQTPNGASR